MFDSAKAASILYGGTAPDQEDNQAVLDPTLQEKAGQQPESQSLGENAKPTPADTLYSKADPIDHEAVLAEHGFATPDEIKAEREARNKDTFGYSESAIGQEVRQRITELVQEVTPDAPVSLNQAAAQGYVRMASDLGFADAEVGELINAAKADHKTALDPDTQQRWTRQSQEWLKSAFAHRADDALQAARTMINRDPRLKQMLLRTGLGNHPQFVATMCRRAMALKNTGKLGGRKNA